MPLQQREYISPRITDIALVWGVLCIKTHKSQRASLTQQLLGYIFRFHACSCLPNSCRGGVAPRNDGCCPRCVGGEPRMVTSKGSAARISAILWDLDPPLDQSVNSSLRCCASYQLLLSLPKPQRDAKRLRQATAREHRCPAHTYAHRRAPNDPPVISKSCQDLSVSGSVAPKPLS